MKSNDKKNKCHVISPSSLDNYNQLLKYLDKKQQEKLQEIEPINDTIQTFLKKIDTDLEKYNSRNFTGIRCDDNKEYNDPNVYDENNEINKFIIKFLIDGKIPISKRNNGPPKQKVENKNEFLKPESHIKKIKKDIFVEINNLDDLLKLIDDNKLDDTIEYNIDLESLHKIKEPLIELNNMIGMKDLKENILDQILYFSQNLHKNGDNGKIAGDYMHTVIYGPPGTGKTEVAIIMGKIYSKMGILKKDIFKKVTRSDLIAGYLGQTAIKTKDVINECLGGILFIDEAYALGNSEKTDSFSKECIDTLCEALSVHKDNLMVIIAGYENELKECFFNYNQGLDSRFTWRFKTEEYKAKDILSIFLKKVNDIGWTIAEDSKPKINVEWFEKNMIYFKFFGRDCEVFLSKIKIAHSRRIFCKSLNEKTQITFKDLEKGFEIYLRNDDVKNRKEELNRKFALSGMYL